MKHSICAIRDSAIEAYMRPFTAQTPGQAHRLFVDEVRREGSEIGAHPEDYAIYHLADFDDNTGMITPIDPPKCIQRAIEVIQNSEEK